VRAPQKIQGLFEQDDERIHRNVNSFHIFLLISSLQEVMPLLDVREFLRRTLVVLAVVGVFYFATVLRPLRILSSTLQAEAACVWEVGPVQSWTLCSALCAFGQLRRLCHS
jgi:hypothetical protein